MQERVYTEDHFLDYKLTQNDHQHTQNAHYLPCQESEEDLLEEKDVGFDAFGAVFFQGNGQHLNL